MQRFKAFGLGIPPMDGQISSARFGYFLQKLAAILLSHLTWRNCDFSFVIKGQTTPPPVCVYDLILSRSRTDSLKDKILGLDFYFISYMTKYIVIIQAISWIRKQVAWNLYKFCSMHTENNSQV